MRKVKGERECARWRLATVALVQCHSGNLTRPSNRLRVVDLSTDAGTSRLLPSLACSVDALFVVFFHGFPETVRLLSEEQAFAEDQRDQVAAEKVEVLVLGFEQVLVQHLAESRDFRVRVVVARELVLDDLQSAGALETMLARELLAALLALLVSTDIAETPEEDVAFDSSVLEGAGAHDVGDAQMFVESHGVGDIGATKVDLLQVPFDNGFLLCSRDTARDRAVFVTQRKGVEVGFVYRVYPNGRLSQLEGVACTFLKASPELDRGDAAIVRIVQRFCKPGREELVACPHRLNKSQTMQSPNRGATVHSEERSKSQVLQLLQDTQLLLWDRAKLEKVLPDRPNEGLVRNDTTARRPAVAVESQTYQQSYERARLVGHSLDGPFPINACPGERESKILGVVRLR